MIPNYEKLIDTVNQRLSDLGISSDEISLDHIGYKTSSIVDYQNKKLECSEIPIIHENIVSGRNVAIFKFPKPLIYKENSILAFELVSPKDGETCDSYWEHVEYVINTDLKTFTQNHPQINFDLTAIDRSEFAKVAIRFDDNYSAKFHTETVLAEVAKM